MPLAVYDPDASTLRSREDAEAAANLALSKLTYPGFEIEFYQNLGWQWVLSNGSIDIAEFSDDNTSFVAYANPNDPVAAEGLPSQDINTAVRNVATVILNHANRVGELLEKLTEGKIVEDA